ncbi:MAG: hypothetical protein ACJA1A_000549 [Saprospiraceae bacterium]
MPIAKSESLFLLVKSLSKSEKRSFKLYVGRNQDAKDSLYIKLFDLLDKASGADDLVLKKKLGGLSNAAYSNLKKHLFEQLMIVLRLLSKEKKQNFKIREYIDFSYILYGKGLHWQALEILEKAKRLSQKHYNDFSLLTVIELEKLIQSRHITRTKGDSIDKLIDQSEYLSTRVSDRITLSNIRLKLHKQYVEKGHIESREKEVELMNTFFVNMQTIDESKLEGIEEIYYYQSYVWFHYILDQFEECLKWSIKWVNAFKESEELQRRDVDLYMRGFHYVLTSAYNVKDVPTYEEYLIELEQYRHTNYGKLNHNSQIVSFQYVHNGRMNLHFLNGTFKEGLKDIPSTIKRIKRYSRKLDYHKVMVIYYKVAWMYIGAEEPSNALYYLDYIIDLTDKSLREDIQCYARIMKLMALFDMQEYNQILKYGKDFQKFYDKLKHPNRVQLTVLQMLEKLANAPIFSQKDILREDFEKLKLLKENNFEKRAFIYLDVLPWISSKLERRSIGESVRGI